MSELLSVIQKEVEAREISNGIKVTPEKPKVTPPPPPPPPLKLPSHDFAMALMVNGQSPENKIQCAYCSGNQFSASCTETIEVPARLDILKRDRRCCLPQKWTSKQSMF